MTDRAARKPRLFLSEYCVWAAGRKDSTGDDEGGMRTTRSIDNYKGVEMTTRFRLALLLVLASIPASIGAASLIEGGGAQSSSTAAALKTAASFHESLGGGDSTNAVRLLAPDAIILESGVRETRAEYVAHHLGEDIEFARAVSTTRKVLDTRRQDDVVWVIASSESKGRFHERQIDSRGVELMVLTRSRQRWLINAIHWSSRRSGP